MVIAQRGAKQHQIVEQAKSNIIDGMEQPDVGAAPVVKDFFHNGFRLAASAHSHFLEVR